MSTRDKKILIIFLGLMIFALVYYFPVRSLMEEADTLRADNTALVPRLAELQNKVIKEAEIKAETAKLREDTKKLIRTFPSYIQTENEVMDLIGLEEKNKMGITSITVGLPVQLQVGVAAPAAETQAAPTEGEEATKAEGETAPAEAPTVASQYQLFDIGTTINYKGGYTNFKDFVDDIAKSSDKKSLNNVSVAFDNTSGDLNGAIVYDSFYLAGSDRPYEDIITSGIKRGTDNIFGTVDTAEPAKDKEEKPNGE